jgi:hypothetical protein
MTSIIKVDNLQNQCGANIINENAGTITIGASGDTIALAAGASQSGFGRTGTVNWDTTAKTANFTAVSGEGYFVNTTSGEITVSLPEGSAGAIISLADYTNTWQTNNVTINANGSEKIGGVAAPAILNTEGQSVTFVYVDATEGWKNVQDSTSNVVGNPFIVATGGTITCDGDYKIHTFTGPGTFTVTNIATDPANNVVDYLVVAGGGGGGGADDLCGGGGGAGAGGFRTSDYSYSGPPLASSCGVTITATNYPITIGAGGLGGFACVPASPPGNPTRCGASGSPSVFSTITSTGGGGGGSPASCGVGKSGGSGGGAARANAAGSGNTPPTSPSQGNNGGTGPTNSPTNVGRGGGGGGANAVGQCSPAGGGGGNGEPNSITGSAVTYAGGGGGGADNDPPGPVFEGPGPGGTGGGGNGGSNGIGGGGTINTGGGGGGGSTVDPDPGNAGGAGGNGGSGIIIIRYKFQ